MAEQKWGVTDVTIRYFSGDEEWEVSLDPKKIDILVFNWERYKAISSQIGSPADRDREILPDGRGRNGKPAADVAREMGLKGPPVRTGKRRDGTSYDPVCVHNEDCTWWCIDEGHHHDEN